MTVTALPVVPPGRWVDRAHRQQQRRSRHQRLLLVSAVAAAAALGSSGLGDRSATYDEALAVRLSQLGWTDWVRVVWRRETDDAAWQLMARLVLEAPGPDLAAARALSVLCVVAAVVLVGLVGARIVGRRVGAAAGLVTALHPAVVDAARTADGRAAALLGVVGGVLLLERATRPAAPSTGAWTGAVALAVLAGYSSPLAVPVIVSAAAVLVVWRRQWSPAAACASVTYAVLQLPLLAAAASGRLTDSGLLSAAREQGDVWGRSLAVLGGGGSWRVPVLVLAVAGLSLAALRRTVLVWPLRGEPRQGLLLTWLAAPFLASAAVGVVAPVLRPELTVLAVPALALMGAVLAVTLVDRRAAALMLTAIALGLLPGAVSAAIAPVQRDWRWVANTVAAEARPGDVVVVLPTYEQLPLGLAVEAEGVLESMPGPPGVPAGDGDDLSQSPASDPLGGPLSAHRVWLVLATGDEPPPAASLALAGRELAVRLTRREVTILRYDG